MKVTDDLDAQKELEDHKAALVAKQRRTEQTYEGKLAARTARQQTRSDLFNSTISAGQLALRTLVTLSGGALIAILALIGNLSGKQDETAQQIAASAIDGAPRFALALMIAGVAVGVVYLAQACFTLAIDNEDQETKFQHWNTMGNGFSLFCIGLTITSFMFFCNGVYQMIPPAIWAKWLG